MSPADVFSIGKAYFRAIPERHIFDNAGHIAPGCPCIHPYCTTRRPRNANPPLQSCQTQFLAEHCHSRHKGATRNFDCLRRESPWPWVNFSRADDESEKSTIVGDYVRPCAQNPDRDPTGFCEAACLNELLSVSRLSKRPCWTTHPERAVVSQRHTKLNKREAS